MSEQKLCWKCREERRKRFIVEWPGDHCHHPEPEEKPKCACNLIHPFDYGLDVQIQIGRSDGCVTFYPTKLNFCSQCGRKL